MSEQMHAAAQVMGEHRALSEAAKASIRVATGIHEVVHPEEIVFEPGHDTAAVVLTEFLNDAIMKDKDAKGLVIPGYNIPERGEDGESSIFFASLPGVPKYQVDNAIANASHYLNLRLEATASPYRLPVRQVAHGLTYISAAAKQRRS